MPCLFVFGPLEISVSAATSEVMIPAPLRGLGSPQALLSRIKPDVSSTEAPLAGPIRWWSSRPSTPWQSSSPLAITGLYNGQDFQSHSLFRRPLGAQQGKFADKPRRRGLERGVAAQSHPVVRGPFIP